jgi:DNA-binding transcriptional LysR family regulator
VATCAGIAASDEEQRIEGVFSQFLHRYAERYPNVQVKVSEGSGLEILAMLERGEIHLGQMLPSGVPPDDGRFGSQPRAIHR